jgi:hypothetical protein
MNYPHEYNEKSSFELTLPEAYILAQEKRYTTKTRHIMFRAYPHFMAAQNERRSYNRGFLANFFGFLFGRQKAA